MTGPILLLLTTLIWGTAFLAQKVGGESIGPFALTCARSVLGGFFLCACAGLRHLRGRRAGFPFGRSVLFGIACGVPLFAAMIAQQIGIATTTPGISAFLTTNYVLFVPVLAALLSRRLPPGYVWFGCLLSLGGTYLICLPGEGLSVGRGEAWTLLCAVLFSVQMIVVDRTASRADLLVLSATQLFTCAVLSLPFAVLPAERAQLAHLVDFSNLAAFSHPLWSIVYLGVFSSGIAYTLQNYGQARTPPALAAIVLSMESVFGALSGWLVLGDRLSVAQFAGCATVFAAIVITQLLSLPRRV